MQCGASFEERKGDHYADAELAERQDCQGQRRDGSPNALSLAEHSIEEANCTSLPFRLGATFYPALLECATMRRAEPPFLTGHASTNFPSASMAVNAQQNIATSDTSAAMTERCSGDSLFRYHAAQWELVSHYENPDTSATVHPLTDILRHETVLEIDGSHGLTLKQLANELLPLQPVTKVERQIDDHMSLSTPDSGLRYHISRPLQEASENQCVEIETIENQTETDDYAGTEGRGMPCSVLPLRQTFAGLQPLKEPETNVGETIETAVLSQICGPRMLQEVSCSVGIEYAQVCSDVSFKAELRNENSKRPFNSEGMVATIKRIRTMVTDEVLFSNAVPIGAFRDRETAVSFLSNLMHDTCNGPVFTGQCGAEERLPWVDVSDDLAHGMVLSVSDGVVSREWTRVPDKDVTIPLYNNKRHNVEPNDWLCHTRDIESGPSNNASEFKELSLCPHGALPGALPHLGYCEKRATSNTAGNCHDSRPSTSITSLLHGMKTLSVARGESRRPHYLSERLPPELRNDVSGIIARYREGLSTQTEVQDQPFECYAIEGKSRIPGEPSKTVARDELHYTSAVPITPKAFTEGRTSAVDEYTCTSFRHASTEHTVLSYSERPGGDGDAVPGYSSNIYETTHSFPQLSFSGIGSDCPSWREYIEPPTISSGARSDFSLVSSSTRLPTYTRDASFCASQYEACGGPVSFRGKLSKLGQQVRDACQEEETATLFETSDVDSSSRSPTFKTQRSDDSFEVPCSQRPASQGEDEGESFYDEELAPRDHYVGLVKLSRKETSQRVSDDDDNKENCNEASLSRSRSEGGQHRIKLGALSHPCARTLAPRSLTQRGRPLCYKPAPSVNGCESEGEDDDFDSDKSCTLYSESDDEYSDTSDSDVFEHREHPSTYSSDSDDSESGRRTVPAVPPLSNIAKGRDEERTGTKEREIDDDSELFSSASSASTLTGKRKRCPFPSELSESPIAVKVMRRYPVPGLQDGIGVDSADVVCLNQHMQCSMDGVELAQSPHPEVWNLRNVDTQSREGTVQGSWESFHNRYKNTTREGPPFYRAPDKWTLGDSDRCGDGRIFDGGPGMDAGMNTNYSVTYKKTVNPVTSGKELVRLVDYEELTPERSGSKSPPQQQPHEEPQRCLSEGCEKMTRPTESEQAGTGTYKKVMEVYFDEDSRRFMVVPTSDECLVQDEALEQKDRSADAEKEETSVSSDPTMPVELCKIRALNEQVAPRKRAAAIVDSSEDTMYPEEAYCGVPRKVRRIGLPKHYRGPGLHPKWKANSDN